MVVLVVADVALLAIVATAVVAANVVAAARKFAVRFISFRCSPRCALRISLKHDDYRCEGHAVERCFRWISCYRHISQPLGRRVGEHPQRSETEMSLKQTGVGIVKYNEYLVYILSSLVVTTRKAPEKARAKMQNIMVVCLGCHPRHEKKQEKMHEKKHENMLKKNTKKAR